MFRIIRTAMTMLHDFITICDSYCDAVGLSRSRVSTIVLNGGKRLDAIAAGKSDLATRTYERAMLWFSTNWPDDADWPEGIDRPLPPDREQPPIEPTTRSVEVEVGS